MTQRQRRRLFAGMIDVMIYIAMVAFSMIGVQPIVVASLLFPYGAWCYYDGTTRFDLRDA